MSALTDGLAGGSTSPADAALRETDRPGRRDDLGGRAVRAGIWLAGLRLATRTLGLVRNVVLARLLSPNDIGTFAASLIVLSFIDRFSSTGTQAALIQRRGDVRDHLDTAWTISVLRGLALGLLLVGVGRQVAALLGVAAAGPMTQVLGLVVVLRGAENIGVTLLDRDLKARGRFVYKIGGTLVDLTVSIGLVFVLSSAWALLGGLVAGALASLVISYAVHPYRPRFRLDRARARELGRYGRWVFLSNILFFLAYRGDNAIVSVAFGAAALGAYVLAFSLSEALTVEASQILAGVAFPTYALMQDDLPRLRATFAVTGEAVASIVLPSAVALALLAEPLVHVLLGARWAVVAPLIWPLALAGCVRALVNNGKSLCGARGRPMNSFLTSGVGVVVTYALMLPLTRAYGLVGVSLAVLGGMIATLPVSAHYVGRALGTDLRYALGMLLPGAILALCVAGAVLASMGATPADHATRLLAGVLAGGAAYAAAAAVLWRRFRTGPVRTGRLALQRAPHPRAPRAAAA